MLNEADTMVGKLAVLLLIFTFGVSIVVRLFYELHVDDEPERITYTQTSKTTSSSYVGTASISSMTTTTL